MYSVLSSPRKVRSGLLELMQMVLVYAADRLQLPQLANHSGRRACPDAPALRCPPRIVLFRSLYFKCRLARYSKITS